MGERGAIDFEPEVEFPEDPFLAARLYLALMAYPERGAGLPSGQGASFAAALGSYVMWHRRRNHGLQSVRKMIGNPEYRPPRRRDFEGALERGRRRLVRRFAAFEIVGNQLINAIFNAGIVARRVAAERTPADAFYVSSENIYGAIRQEIWDKATPSARGIVRRDPEKWAARFSLNETGASADTVQKERDLVSRGFLQSRPVLHMAHGLNQFLADSDDPFPGFGEVDWLLLLIWHAESWVWRALQDAVQWRGVAHWERIMVGPDHMVELILPKNVQENAHCETARKTGRTAREGGSDANE